MDGCPGDPAVPASPLPGAPSPPINMGATPGGQTCNVSAASTSPTLPVNIASLPVNMANIPAVAAAAMGLPSAPFTADGAPTGGVAGAVGGAAALQAALINTALSGAGPASDRATATGGGTAEVVGLGLLVSTVDLVHAQLHLPLVRFVEQ